MNSLKSCVNQISGPISGVFRMRYPNISLTRDGRPFLSLQLEDYSGSLQAYAWGRDVFDNVQLQDLSCIFVRGMLRRRADGPVIDVSQINPLTVTEGEVIRLIPSSLCPMPWLLVFLYVCVDRLTTPALLRFVSQILANDSIVFPFISIPASLHHHHNYPAGLLAHSIECMQMVDRFREFNSRDREIGMVAALLHDVGKILTLTPDMQRTTLGCTVDHDKLTNEILSPYFDSLASEWSYGSEQLKYILNWRQSSRIPRYDMADVVACCDRISTGLDLQRRGLPLARMEANVAELEV